MNELTTAPTPEIPKAYDPREAESKWYQVWRERGYFRAEDTSSKPSFCIVIPPPNVTGELHMGHAVFVTLQDLLTRWKRMSGFNALWLPGTDHAGIATQMVVERELKKIEGKSRHDLGREEFLKRVWGWKDKCGNRILEQLQVLGASCDWDRLRFTMDEGLSRAVREAFVRLYEEGLIYRAQRLINWCPRCHTALSDLEVEHEEKTGKLWHIAYPVKDSDVRLVVATTRPETMLGDTAVAVHPDDPRYKDLIGKKVVLPLVHREIPIIGDPQLVSMELGTGAVKVTPAHDFNDYATGQRHGLESIAIFDLAARTNAKAGPYAGLSRDEARDRVLADLEAQGLLVKTEDHKLSIGVCQRCGDVVEPTLSPQWFVKVAPLAEPAIAAVEKGETTFVPEPWTNTYFGWMRNLHDWCISRQLWWGHQIPAWYCGCGEIVVSREEPASCPKCGGTLKRDEDVLDTWFSSGLWPFSTLGWPEQTKALETFYPTSVMETGHDIIFFWVARMMMFGLHFMGEVPFRTVFLHAMVRDEKGDKMSKVKGNVIDPLDVIRGQADASKLTPELKKKYAGKGMPAYGADALRFTLTALTAQGRDIKLSLDRLEGYRNFVNKLWNASRFVLMNLGEGAVRSNPLSFAHADKGRRLFGVGSISLADRWILSRLQRAVKETLEALEAYKFNEASSTLYQFIWGEFCDWYIELSKGALYGADEDAKATTRSVLVHVLDQLLKLLHPFMPYVTEEIWQRLPRRPGDPESIMIAAYPSAEAALIDADAEREMAAVIGAVDGIRNIRGESNIAPSKKIRAVVHVAPELGAMIERNRAYIEPLAGLATLEVTAPGPKPRVSATFVGEGMEIFVPLEGIIDLAEEIRRLEKERAKVDADLELLTKKLANPSFAQRAPAEVVEKDRARVADLEQKRAKLMQGIARLQADSAPAAEPEVVEGVQPGTEPEAPPAPENDEISRAVKGSKPARAPEKSANTRAVPIRKVEPPAAPAGLEKEMVSRAVKESKPARAPEKSTKTQAMPIRKVEPPAASAVLEKEMVSRAVKESKPARAPGKSAKTRAVPIRKVEPPAAPAAAKKKAATKRKAVPAVARKTKKAPSKAAARGVAKGKSGTSAPKRPARPASRPVAKKKAGARKALSAATPPKRKTAPSKALKKPAPKTAAKSSKQAATKRAKAAKAKR